ncbi:hypothetical protein BKA69DRAFT_1093112 [Paraphysoderma sedebokerense]|nr:hypothetical protein BKA69DRAFT_1093112 [Paraphysoderma sedebokerense]
MLPSIRRLHSNPLILGLLSLTLPFLIIAAKQTPFFMSDNSRPSNSPLNLFITSTDALLAYITAVELLSNFNDDTPIFLPPSYSSIKQLDHPQYQIFCGIADPESEHAKIVQNLGCTVVPIPNESSHADIVKSLKLFDVTHLLLIPPVVPKLNEISKNYLLAADELKLQSVVIWSRIGSEMGTNALGMYKDIETFLQNGGVKNINYTVLKLAFIMDRFLDFSQIIQDESSIPIPIGHGSFAPITIRDAALSSHKILTNPSEHNKKVYTITGASLINGTTLAKSATKTLCPSLRHPYEFDPKLSLKEAQKMYSQLENFDVTLVKLLIEVFGLIRDGKMDMISEDGQMLVGKGKLKDTDWFWKRYEDYFCVGGE